MLSSETVHVTRVPSPYRIDSVRAVAAAAAVVLTVSEYAVLPVHACVVHFVDRTQNNADPVSNRTVSACGGVPMLIWPTRVLARKSHASVPFVPAASLLNLCTNGIDDCPNSEKRLAEASDSRNGQQNTMTGGTGSLKLTWCKFN